MTQSVVEDQDELMRELRRQRRESESRLRNIDFMLRDLIQEVEASVEKARTYVRRASPDWEQAEKMTDAIDPLLRRCAEIKKQL